MLKKAYTLDYAEFANYLPLFMQHLSHCELKNKLLGEAIGVIAMIGTKLKKQKPPYINIFCSVGGRYCPL